MNATKPFTAKSAALLGLGALLAVAIGGCASQAADPQTPEAIKAALAPPGPVSPQKAAQAAVEQANNKQIAEAMNAAHPHSHQ
jgi:ABC-type glycerol-3-phosphate transport system substrate-binding protein